MVSCLPLNLGTWIRIPVGAWLWSSNAWIRGQEITSSKSQIAAVRLTEWCIIIKKKKKSKMFIIQVGSTMFNNISANISRVRPVRYKHQYAATVLHLIKGVVSVYWPIFTDCRGAIFTDCRIAIFTDCRGAIFTDCWGAIFTDCKVQYLLIVEVQYLLIVGVQYLLIVGCNIYWL